MGNIISPAIAKNLASNAHYESLIDGTYLNDSSKEAFQEIVEKFFPGKYERAKILNPGSYIMSIVYQWNKSYFGSPTTNYDIDWDNVMRGVLIDGHIRLKINPDKEELEAIDPSSYYFDGIKEYFVKTFSRTDESGDKESFVMLETFANKIFTRKLFKVYGFDSISQGEEVGLGYLEETKDLVSACTIDLKKLVISKKVSLKLCKILETQINSIDRKIASNDHTIMDYGKVWTIIKGVNVDHAVDPDSLVLDVNKLGRYLIDNGNGKADGIQPGVEIVKQAYDGIDASLKIIDSQLMNISAITGIPAHAFKGDIRAGSESGKSKEKTSEIFYKTIQSYHDAVRSIFEEFWEIIGASEKDRILEFPEIITTSTQDLLEIEAKRIENERNKLELGLTTRELSVMQVHNVGEKEARLLLKKVANDTERENTSTEAEDKE